MPIDDSILSTLGSCHWPFDAKSGLLHVTDRNRITVSMNVSNRINEFSPYYCATGVSFEDNGGALIDTYYGNCYSGIPDSGFAIYGESNKMPYQPFDEEATGFLRVPFKRIPCVPVRNLADIRRITNVLSNIYGKNALLFRGQPQAYYLERSWEAQELLYGGRNVLEPSLLASSSRRQPSIESCMSEWMMLVQVIQELCIKALCNDVNDNSNLSFDQVYDQMNSKWRGQPFYYYCLALAQHYGLPTAGLDLTDDLSTSLFFALNLLQATSSGVLRPQPVEHNSAPVLYILRRAQSKEYSFRESTHELFQSGRPMCQNAWFLNVGWGLSRNAAANQILIALQLEPGADYGPIANATDLFPGLDKDSIARFMGSIKGEMSENLNRVLEGFYWVEE